LLQLGSKINNLEREQQSLSALKCLVKAEFALKAVVIIRLELELGIELEPELKLKLELELARKIKVFIFIIDTKVFKAMKSSLLAPKKH
jgi:hypothetical protein